MTDFLEWLNAMCGMIWIVFIILMVAHGIGIML